MDHGNNNACHYNCFNGKFAMSNLDNGDLPEDFEKKELEPIPFGDLPLTFIDMINLVKFTELLKGDKKD